MEGVIKDVILHSYTTHDFTKTDLSSRFEDDLSKSQHGKYFSLHRTLVIDPTSLYIIQLTTNLQYFIHIHDPDLYLFTKTPETIPMVKVHIDDPSLMVQVPVKITRVVSLNRHPTYLCNSNPDYSFTKCLRKSN